MTKALPTAAAVHDDLYLKHGLASQRSYPNEGLVRFLGRHYFRLGPAERAATRILEIGCGAGGNLWAIAKEGFAAYGFDGSPAALALARRHLEEKWGVRATLKEGTFTRFPFDAGTFDAVLDAHSLQHSTLAESRLALAEVRRVLKPGGRFFSFRMSDRSVLRTESGGRFVDEVTVDGIKNKALPLAIDCFNSFWSPQVARREYEAAGLTVVSLERIGRTYEFGRHYVEYLEIGAEKPA